MANKIRVYGLNVKDAKAFYEKGFTVTDFIESENETFDMELANIDAVSLHDNGITIISCENEYFISRNAFKEVIII